MATPFPEPRTNSQAKALQTFLQKGAATTIEMVKSVDATVRAPLRLDGPVRVPFPVAAPELIAALDSDSANNGYLDVEITGAMGEGLPNLLVFLTAGGANARVPRDASDPSFVGAIAFFSHGSGDMADMPLRFRLRATTALKNVRDAKQTLTTVLVPDPLSEGQQSKIIPTVTAAQIQVLRSSIK